MELSNITKKSKLFSINWSTLPCVMIGELADRLDAMGDAFDKRADAATAAGNSADAATFQHIANEAHLEADNGRMHREIGNCQQGDRILSPSIDVD